jgi:hypothetical protein
MPQAPGNIEELRKQIEAAFGQARYPGDDHLVDDNSGYPGAESTDIAAAFRGKHWKDLPLETLRYFSAALSFFTPEAYHFYLPAFLITSALRYDDADILPGAVLFHLTPPGERYADDYYAQRLALFTPSQLQPSSPSWNS